MESVLKLLDDLDDLRVFLHVQSRVVILTTLLLAACAALLVGVLIL